MIPLQALYTHRFSAWIVAWPSKRTSSMGSMASLSIARMNFVAIDSIVATFCSKTFEPSPVKVTFCFKFSMSLAFRPLLEELYMKNVVSTENEPWNTVTLCPWQAAGTPCKWYPWGEIRSPLLHETYSSLLTSSSLDLDWDRQCSHLAEILLAREK